MEVPKICSVCNNSLAISGISLGSCTHCRKILHEDIASFMRCIEEVLVNKGYPLSTIYHTQQLGDCVAGRRLMFLAFNRLAGYSSSKIRSLFEIRGKLLSDATIRHHILVARDLYSVSKSFATVLDDFLADVIKAYKSSPNLFKKLKITNFDTIVNILTELDISISMTKAVEITNKILLVILNSNPNELKRAPED